MQRILGILTVVSLLMAVPAFSAPRNGPPSKPPVYHPSAAAKKRKPKKAKQVAVYGSEAQKARAKAARRR